MRLVTANIQIQLFKLDEGRSVLTALGARGMTVTEVKGFGQQKAHAEIYRGTEYALNFVPKVRIDLVVASEQADKVIAAIQVTARTGQVGDGKTFVSPIERAVRIRIGETDKAAVQTFTDISCDEEGDNGIRNIRAPKTRVIRGCSLGDRDSLSCIR
jgi:nitrogen regulatory protein P-II 2